ncbi:lysozyme inhibitor LprI family protein [Leptolyngbya sp. FACHB-261]|uniref:lysozyme inhibitor LprI family protein n=1 Tax=Leptolyngbya sp. FACHB-261 TaxID=2692806 RepID=UPI0016821799|nr:lysozyme inhibitor LprI family protein [Leptolyngbya sp. FACHB-261]MBD2101260.1 DUF1311 domain-containing protein [Leptolyngbya sp. FACHB-261]
MRLGAALLLGTISTLTLASGAMGQQTGQQMGQQSAQPNCAAPQSTLEMRTCTSQEYQAADRNLNQVYQRLMASLPASRRQKLTVAQRAWVQYRDATCAFSSSEFEGGTFEPVALTSCFTQVTQQRTRELQQGLNNPR